MDSTPEVLIWHRTVGNTRYRFEARPALRRDAPVPLEVVRITQTDDGSGEFDTVQTETLVPIKTNHVVWPRQDGTVVDALRVVPADAVPRPPPIEIATLRAIASERLTYALGEVDGVVEAPAGFAVSSDTAVLTVDPIAQGQFKVDVIAIGAMSGQRRTLRIEVPIVDLRIDWRSTDPVADLRDRYTANGQLSVALGATSPSVNAIEWSVLDHRDGVSVDERTGVLSASRRIGVADVTVRARVGFAGLSEHIDRTFSLNPADFLRTMSARRAPGHAFRIDQPVPELHPIELAPEDDGADGETGVQRLVVGKRSGFAGTAAVSGSTGWSLVVRVRARSVGRLLDVPNRVRIDSGAPSIAGRNARDGFVAFASGESEPHRAANVLDPSLDKTWLAVDGTDSDRPWIALDLGESRQVSGITFTGRSIGSLVAGLPHEYRAEISTTAHAGAHGDAAEWVEVSSGIAYPLSGLAYEARDRVLDSSEFTASALSTHSTHLPEHALDSSTSTYWHNNTTHPKPTWFAIDTKSPLLISGARILPQQSSGSFSVPRDYRIETSTDGSTWTLVASGEAYPAVETWSGNPAPSWPVTIRFDPVLARHVRFWIDSITAPDRPAWAAGLASMELVAEEAVAVPQSVAPITVAFPTGPVAARSVRVVVVTDVARVLGATTDGRAGALAAMDVIFAPPAATVAWGSDGTQTSDTALATPSLATSTKTTPPSDEIARWSTFSIAADDAAPPIVSVDSAHSTLLSSARRTTPSHNGATQVTIGYASGLQDGAMDADFSHFLLFDRRLSKLDLEAVAASVALGVAIGPDTPDEAASLTFVGSFDGFGGEYAREIARSPAFTFPQADGADTAPRNIVIEARPYPMRVIAFGDRTDVTVAADGATALSTWAVNPRYGNCSETTVPARTRAVVEVAASATGNGTGPDTKLVMAFARDLGARWPQAGTARGDVRHLYGADGTLTHRLLLDGILASDTPPTFELGGWTGADPPAGVEIGVTRDGLLTVSSTADVPESVYVFATVERDGMRDVVGTEIPLLSTRTTPPALFSGGAGSTFFKLEAKESSQGVGVHDLSYMVALRKTGGSSGLYLDLRPYGTDLSNGFSVMFRVREVQDQNRGSVPIFNTYGRDRHTTQINSQFYFTKQRIQVRTFGSSAVRDHGVANIDHYLSHDDMVALGVWATYTLAVSTDRVNLVVDGVVRYSNEHPIDLSAIEAIGLNVAYGRFEGDVSHFRFFDRTLATAEIVRVCDDFSR